MTASGMSAVEIDVGADGDGPYGICALDDGSVAFTLVHAGAIGRLDPSGGLTTVKLDEGAEPMLIAVDAGGNLWFTRHGDASIGRLDRHGKLTSVPVPTTDSGPYGLVAGPDGAIWFTEARADHVGRVDIHDLTVEELPVPAGFGFPGAIAVGPDGDLWFSLFRGGGVGRCTVDGDVTVVQLPDPASGPVGLTLGPDGAMWFAGVAGDVIGRIDTSGDVTTIPLTEGAGPHARRRLQRLPLVHRVGSGQSGSARDGRIDRSCRPVAEQRTSRHRCDTGRKVVGGA